MPFIAGLCADYLPAASRCSRFVHARGSHLRRIQHDCLF